MARRIAIIGGGYAGAAAAIHFAQRASHTLDITVIEPRSEVGLGTAYSSPNDVVRLNVEDSLMVTDVSDIPRFPRWLTQSGERAHDPDGLDPKGEFYARRASFGRYMAEQFAEAQRANASDSTIRHLQDRAIQLSVNGAETVIALSNSVTITADLTVLAIGNERPMPVSGLPDSVQKHSKFVQDPWLGGCLDIIGHEDRVLIIGSGLTAVDVIAMLTDAGHIGALSVVSRRGQMPRGQGDFPGIEELLRRNLQPVPPYITRHGMPKNVSEILRCVRADIAKAHDRGESWHDAFDAVRDAAKHIWPALSLIERRRFFRHLKPYYDSHRFRVAPQIDEIVQNRLDGGSLTVSAARIVGGDVDGDQLRVDFRHRYQTGCQSGRFDAIVNCTGPNPDPAASEIALLQTAIADGLLATDACGVGLAVNEHCETLSADLMPNSSILALGPLTKGQFAESVAVPQITMQLLPLTERLVSERRL